MSESAVLVQVHIPRAAGTSVSAWLRSAAESGSTSGHAELYPTYALLSEAQLNDAWVPDERVTTISTHNIRLFPPKLCDRPAWYFTILREPLDHFGSLVRYIIQHREAFRVPHGLREPRDVAEWFLDSRFGEIGSENIQTNHLALYTWCRETGATCRPDEYALWSGREHHEYWDGRLDVAKGVLRSFFCVGIFEQLHGSLELLRRRADGIGIRLLPPADVPAINGTRREAGDRRWMDPDTTLGAMIADATAVDRELYTYALALYDAQRRTTFGEHRSAC